MPKRTKKNRYMKKGGDVLAQAPPPAQVPPTAQATPSTFSTWFNGAKKAASSAASSVSSAASSAANSVSSAANSATSSLTNSVSTPTGGKRRRKGGTDARMSLTDLASTASPISSTPSAKPQVWVGGKRSYRKLTKSRKLQTYKKGNRKKRSRKSKFPFSESLKRLVKM